MSEPEQPEPGVETEAMATALETDASARQWGMIAHLSALAGFIIPFGNLIGPLIVWQMNKEVPFAADQGKEALNFQITVSLVVLLCIVLLIIAIGALLLPVVGIAALVFVIIAALKANEGVRYRYPYTFRFIS